MILNFSEFNNKYINENMNDNIIKDIRNNSGYSINVIDVKSGKIENNKIYANDLGEYIDIYYINDRGKKSRNIAIPKDGININIENDKIKQIILDPYKKWINIKNNKNIIDDFIEDFLDSINKKDVNDSINIQLILDLINIPGNLIKIDKSDDELSYTYKLDNNIIIYIEKKDKNNLFSKIEIYKNKKEHLPNIYINSTQTIFNLKKNDKSNYKVIFNEPCLVISKSNIDYRYVRYLILKSLTMEQNIDIKNLINYYNDVKKLKSLQEIKEIKEIIEEFTDINNINDIE